MCSPSVALCVLLPELSSHRGLHRPGGRLCTRELPTPHQRAAAIYLSMWRGKKVFGLSVILGTKDASEAGGQ